MTSVHGRGCGCWLYGSPALPACLPTKRVAGSRLRRQLPAHTPPAQRRGVESASHSRGRKFKNNEVRKEIEIKRGRVRPFSALWADLGPCGGSVWQGCGPRRPACGSTTAAFAQMHTFASAKGKGRETHVHARSSSPPKCKKKGHLSH